MTLIAQMGALLVQGVTAAAETTVVRPVMAGPAWYTTLNQIIGAASVIVFLVLMVILIPAVVKFRKTATKFEAVLDHIERSIDPVTMHASRIVDNIDYITTSIRADVQVLRKTLLVANDGIRDVIESSERRLHEMGAVLRVMQEEAEQAFVSTASTIAGVRAGAAAFHEDGARLAEADTGDEDEGFEALDDEDALDDDFDDDLDSGDDIESETESETESESRRESKRESERESDLDLAVDAAEDMTDGYDNGSTFGRAEPRIRRPSRGDAG